MDKQSITINKNGQVYLPEIGNVSAVELTFDEFEKKISDAFKSFYISVTPSVTLKELKFIQVSILGAVKNPGTYLVNPFTTASNLLSFSKKQSLVATKGRLCSSARSISIFSAIT